MQQKQVQIYKRKAKHIANQYLVDQFQILIQKSKQRQDKSHFNYEKFVKAMTQYPMPLLTQKQAISISGVGEKTAQMIMNKINKQYGHLVKDISELEDLDLDPINFDKDGQLKEEYINQLNKNQESDEEEVSLDQIIDGIAYRYDKKAQQYIEVTGFDQQEIIKEKIFERESRKRSIQQLEQQRYEMGEKKPQKKIEKKIVKQQQQKKNSKKNTNDSEESQEESNDISSSQISLNKNKRKNVKPRAYKPKDGSAAWSVLIALQIFKDTKEEHYASKQDLKNVVQNFKEFTVKIKDFSSIKTLIEKEIIKEWEIQNTQKYELTDKGEELTQELYDKKKIKEKKLRENQQILESQDEDESQISDSDDAFQFNSKQQQNNNNIQKNNENSKFNLQQNSQNNSIFNNSISKNQFNNKMDEEDQFLDELEYIKVKKRDIKSTKIYLYIDEREKRDKNKDCKYFQRQLKNYVTDPDPQIKPLPIGDFLWVIEIFFQNNQSEIYVLDTIVERKTADDLAASIRDKRYKDQKRRLKQAPFSKVMYLVEGKLTQGAGQSYGGAPQITQKTIESAVMSIRIKDKFKVKQTNCSDDTIRWLSMMTLAIKNRFISHLNRIEDDECVEFLAKYDDFKNDNMKHKKTSVQLQLGQMIFMINKSGENAARQIATIFKTPLLFYSQLLKIKEECQQELNNNKRKKKNLQQQMVQKLKEIGKQNDSVVKSQQMRADAAETIIQLFMNFETNQEEFTTSQDSQKVQDFMQKYEKSNSKFLSLTQKKNPQVPQARDFKNIKETIFGREQQSKQKSNNFMQKINLLKENKNLLNSSTQDNYNNSINNFNNNSNKPTVKQKNLMLLEDSEENEDENDNDNDSNFIKRISDKLTKKNNENNFNLEYTNQEFQNDYYKNLSEIQPLINEKQKIQVQKPINNNNNLNQQNDKINNKYQQDNFQSVLGEIFDDDEDLNDLLN